MPEPNSQQTTPRTVGSLTPEQQHKALGILAADRLTGMAGMLRSRLMAERLARKSQDGTLGRETPMHEDEMLSDMNINVGDTYYGLQPPVPAAEQPQPPASPTQSSLGADPATRPTAMQRVPRMLPYVLAAALAGGGLGLGAAALPALLKPDAPAATDTDTDTQYELRITSGQ